MKVAWFDAEKWHEEGIESDHKIVFFNSPADISLVDSSFDAVSVCSDSTLSREFMEEIQPDKILCRTTGYDNVDIKAANDLGIFVQNTPGYSKESVAEYNFGMILNAAKNLGSDSGLNPNTDQGERGLELKNKTLGVIGAGSIGKELLKRAKAFEMDLVAYDPYQDEEAAQKIGFEYVRLEELLEESEIISVNCPLTDSTRGMISENQFEKMDCKVFVNVGRGPVVDTLALQEALENDFVGKAVLDVVEKGGFEKLSDREDVAFTPHNAYNTHDAVMKRIGITLSNLDDRKNTVNDPLTD